MSKFGVNIDLSIFFEDERKMVLIMVDPKWENVECLQKRVQYLFEVDVVRFINSDGSFVPPQEPIEIIKFCKGLKAFVPKESLEKRKKKKSKKNKNTEKLSESEETNNDESQKKRKYYSLESGFSASSTPNYAKRIKAINIQHNKLKQINKSSEISSTCEQKLPPATTTSSLADTSKALKNKSKAVSVTSDYEEPSGEKYSNPCELSPRPSNVEKDDSSNDSANVDQNKKRLTSTPKEKELQDIVKNVEITFNDELKPRPSSVPSSTFINESKMIGPNQMSTQSIQSPNKKNPFKRQPSNNKKSKGHIYFNESGEMVSKISTTSSESKKSLKKCGSSDSKEPQATTIFRCSLDDVSNNDGSPRKPRIFEIRPLAKKEPEKPVIEIQEQIILPPKQVDDKSLSLGISQRTTSSTENKEKTSSAEILEISQQPGNQNDSALSQTTDTANNNTDLSIKKTAESLVDGQNQQDAMEKISSTTVANNSDQTSLDNLQESIVKDSSTDNSSTDTVAKYPDQAVDNLVQSIGENDTVESTTSASVAKEFDQTSMQNLDQSIEEDTKANDLEASVLSIDSADLSIVIDDEDGDYHGKPNKKRLQTSAKAEESHDLTNDDQDSSDIEEISEIIDLNETEDNCDSTFNAASFTQSLNHSKIVVHKILPFCTSLSDLPNIGDIIVFKVPYMDKKLKLTETNFMAGKVEYINKRMKNLKILVLDGFHELSYVPKKLVCNLDVSDNYDRYLQLKMSEMNEPKLFNRS